MHHGSVIQDWKYHSLSPISYPGTLSNDNSDAILILILFDLLHLVIIVVIILRIMVSLFMMMLLIQNIYGANRYIMDDDNDVGLIALPIDVCFLSSGMPPETYTKYSCSTDGQTVTKRKYSDSQCTSSATATEVITKTSATASFGKYTFECSGEDNYVVTGAYFDIFTKDSDCTTVRGEVPTVLGCFQDSETTSFEFGPRSEIDLH